MILFNDLKCYSSVISKEDFCYSVEKSYVNMLYIVVDSISVWNSRMI